MCSGLRFALTDGGELVMMEVAELSCVAHRLWRSRLSRLPVGAAGAHARNQTRSIEAFERHLIAFVQLEANSSPFSPHRATKLLFQSRNRAR